MAIGCKEHCHMKAILALTTAIAVIAVMGVSAMKDHAAPAPGSDALLKIAETRRSIRRYTSEPISPETISNILAIAMLAPSSYGQNPVEFVVVQDRDKLAKLADCKRIGAPSVRASAASVVVMVDTSKGELWPEDGSVAATYLLLAAEQYGIGACWNQIRLRDGQRKSASREICELLGVPERYEVVCVVALGHPKSRLPPHRKEDIDFARLHMGKFK